MEGAPNTPEVTVYSKSPCVQCDATYRSMDKEGVDYTVKMLEDHPDMLEKFKAEGMLQAPIVDTGTEVWSGFRPDKIKALGKIALGE